MIRWLSILGFTLGVGLICSSIFATNTYGIVWLIGLMSVGFVGITIVYDKLFRGL